MTQSRWRFVMRIIRVSHFHQPTFDERLFNGHRVVQ
jgi:hypothetical protein